MAPEEDTQIKLKSPRVTITDVSDALGLTKSTVSRALNGYADISETTRLRVRRMADRMGYRPLSHAQAIRTGRTRSLGLVIQLADHDAQRPFLAEFLAGLSQGASAEGCTLTIATSDSPAATLETFRAMIADRKADGFILPRTMSHDPRAELLRAADVPFVLFGRCADLTGCAYYDVLGENAMRAAVARLTALGHRRIGFINGGMQYAYAELRREGFRDGMRRAGLEIREDWMREGCVTLAAGEAAATAMLSREDRPTAIVTAVDMAAIGVYRAAAHHGLAIGSDLSVISYDGIPDGAHLTPPLSTYAADFTEAGRRLSALLLQRIRGVDPESLREVVEARFLDRGSVGPPVHTTA